MTSDQQQIPPLRILVTGAGAPGIRGTLYALRQGDRPVYTVGTDLNEQAVGRHLVDAFYPVPPPESDDYLDTLAGICERESIDLVIPQTTREIAVLSQHREAIEAGGTRVMVSSAGAVEAANDKAAVLRAFERLGLPVPAWRLTRTEAELIEAAEALGYPDAPVVVKPPVSNGMRGLRILREAAWDARRFLSEKPSGVEIALDDLLDILRRGDDWPALLVTEYLAGPEYSVDAFRGERLEAAMPRRRAAIRSGISFDTTLLPDRADLVEPTLRAASHLDLRYAFGFQFKEDADGVPKVLECNPRVQGTMVASVFGGLNAVWFGVQEALGEAPDALPAPLHSTRFQRYWGGLGITDEDVWEI